IGSLPCLLPAVCGICPAEATRRRLGLPEHAIPHAPNDRREQGRLFVVMAGLVPAIYPLPS
ncbi:MAG: hypothetical protein ACJ8AW_48985, partial [Rhodopila sp.]